MERIGEKRTEIAILNQQLTEATDANRRRLPACKPMYSRWSSWLSKLGSASVTGRHWKRTVPNYAKRRTKASPDYSLFAGLLFLVAGISFLAGDLIISHEIVAYALNIRNPNEAWAFAVGLAMVSILLKPAYDRLIEQPYQENPEKNGLKYTRFNWRWPCFRS